MNIDENTKELINKSFKGAFPKRGQYFYVTRSDGIRDYSYIDDVFKCEGSDPVMVVARCLTDLRTEQFRLNRNHYIFSQVSEEVLNAVGIHPSPEITWTNCAEQMPPDDETEIIIRHVEDKEPILTPANEVFYDIDTLYKECWEWTEFTPEKWEELKND